MASLMGNMIFSRTGWNGFGNASVDIGATLCTLWLFNIAMENHHF